MTKRTWLITLMTLSLTAIAPGYPADLLITQGDQAVESSVTSWTEMRFEGVVEQSYDFSCGAASVATILTYFYNDQKKERAIVKFLLEKIGVEKEKKGNREDLALSFKDLKKYAQSQGYKAVGLALPMDSLRKLQVPVMLYLKTSDYDHFVVFRGMDDQYVYLADPSFGNRSLRIARFKDMFYTSADSKYPGKALVLIPTTDEQKAGINGDYMKIPARSGHVFSVFSNEAAGNAIDDKAISNAITLNPMLR